MKGERYRISGRHTNWGSTQYLVIGLVQKSDVGAWNSIRGETQSVKVKYNWHGDILRVNLGEATDGKYKLAWNLQPYDQTLSNGVANYWIDVDDNPANALMYGLAERYGWTLASSMVTATSGARLIHAHHVCKASQCARCQ